jgi:hypothetical protein
MKPSPSASSIWKGKFEEIAFTNREDVIDPLLNYDRLDMLPGFVPLRIRCLGLFETDQLENRRHEPTELLQTLALDHQREPNHHSINLLLGLSVQQQLHHPLSL